MIGNKLYDFSGFATDDISHMRIIIVFSDIARFGVAIDPQMAGRIVRSLVAWFRTNGRKCNRLGGTARQQRHDGRANERKNFCFHNETTYLPIINLS
jgi:hypothetical protein